MTQVMKCVSMFLVDPSSATKPHRVKGVNISDHADQNRLWWPLLVILFFDPSVVEPAIETASLVPISGQDYLKKIIQVRKMSGTQTVSPIFNS